MKDWIYEFLEILSNSNKTLALLMVAAIGFAGILWWGNIQVADFGSSSNSPFLASFKPVLQYRWEGLAVSWLVFFLGLVIKAYKKDKKRYFS